MENKYCLIVWEEIPEDTQFYLVPWDVYEKHQENVDKAHRCFINTMEDENAEALNYLLSTEAEAGAPEYTGELVAFKLSDEDKGKPILANIQKVIWSGFIL